MGVRKKLGEKSEFLGTFLTMSSFRLMEGTVSGDSLGNYRLALSVELSEEEGNRLVHQLAGLDRVESPDRAETPRLWEEGADPGPEYDDNQDL